MVGTPSQAPSVPSEYSISVSEPDPPEGRQTSEHPSTSGRDPECAIEVFRRPTVAVSKVANFGRGSHFRDAALSSSRTSANREVRDDHAATSPPSATRITAGSTPLHVLVRRPLGPGVMAFSFRVINDDRSSQALGLDAPHRDMEILTAARCPRTSRFDGLPPDHWSGRRPVHDRGRRDAQRIQCVEGRCLALSRSGLFSKRGLEPRYDRAFATRRGRRLVASRDGSVEASSCTRTCSIRGSIQR